ncbi:GATA zinc finger domain-containing protein 7-like isoform X3 [Cotesia glomerata]|uniref:GATA zinc finger domain-containing protein 7-like isoform X3 n=1 Tax=Cotesia glomerata TaxID=32391 RepID=UPI001D002BC8|nr:GATA zinc finger domain-containing protein 7-like isoform X3 [Cotesia glomerata]
MRFKGGNLLGYALFILILHLHDEVEGGGGVCKDLQGQTYDSGFYYIPEPCTLCVCDNGNPKWCKAVICRLSQKSIPKQDCKSFRIGTPCCEFICLDDTLSSVTNDKTDGIEGNNGDSSASYDLGLRLVASCITAILSLSLLFFLIHRLRQRKIRGRQNRELTEEQRSLGSMGYLERGGLPHGMQMDEMACGGGYSLWKPPGNYFPRGEAPPPYEEAVAAARAEQALLTMNPNALSSLNLPNSYLTTQHHSMSAAIPTANLPATAPPPAAYSATSPSSSVNTRQINSSQPHPCHQQLLPPTEENISAGYYSGGAVTNFSVETNIYENTVPVPVPVSMTNQQRSPEHSSGTHSTHSNHNAHNHNHNHGNHGNEQTHLQSYRESLRHTALPRQGSAFTISATVPNPNTISTHRTIPRTLTTSTNAKLRRDFVSHQQPGVLPLVNASTKNAKSTEHIPRLSMSSLITANASASAGASASASTSTSTGTSISINGNDNNLPLTNSGHIEIRGDNQQRLAVDPQPSSSEIKNNFTTPVRDKAPSLIFSNSAEQDGSFDSVTCTCSTQVLPTLHDDTDDYRSECENCKSATGSRYYLDNEDELVTSPHETMTLHRRPEETAASITPQYYRTSLTLPTSTRQRTRGAGGRGNWFSSMPESSTESSDND